MCYYTGAAVTCVQLCLDFQLVPNIYTFSNTQGIVMAVKRIKFTEGERERERGKERENERERRGGYRGRESRPENMFINRCVSSCHCHPSNFEVKSATTG